MASNYRRLLIAVAINTVVMFVITYALIDQLDHFYPNVNRFYMAVMMSAPMVIVMVLVMLPMYENRRLNAIVISAAALVFVTAFGLARSQTLVGDDQFLRSMIPHHSSAIVMCEHSSISDPEIIELCEEIVETQEREIAEMKDILGRR